MNQGLLANVRIGTAGGSADRGRVTRSTRWTRAFCTRLFHGRTLAHASSRAHAWRRPSFPLCVAFAKPRCSLLVGCCWRATSIRARPARRLASSCLERRKRPALAYAACLATSRLLSRLTSNQTANDCLAATVFSSWPTQLVGPKQGGHTVRIGGPSVLTRPPVLPPNPWRCPNPSTELVNGRGTLSANFNKWLHTSLNLISLDWLRTSAQHYTRGITLASMCFVRQLRGILC